MESTQHVCGAQGFGQSIYDTCPACTKWQEERYSAARTRIVRLLLRDLNTQIELAHKANCSVPDVQKTLEEVFSL